ncbi:TPA: hypothetical protein N0F65_004246 [Lagenidium giganteum]|uniref:Amino acid transporter n=1 Tax=Lagenidium giganteum TaxID=4803 RepID=A0AAV2Z9N2_9STRA|nr:TPA: hypothetical protein N0F65_004246 [Lagenidium giganteum]
MYEIKNNRPKIVLYDDDESQVQNSDYIDQLTPPDSEASAHAFFSEDMTNRQTDASTPQYIARSLDSYTRPQNHGEAIAYQYDEGESNWKRHMTTNNLVILGVIVGIGLGVLLSAMGASDDVSELVLLPGNMFLRLLKCFVLPMIFVSLSTGIANIVLLGKVQSIGTPTTAFFLLTMAVGATISLAIALFLRRLTPSVAHSETFSTNATLTFQCSNGNYLALMTNNSVACAGTALSANLTTFELEDINGAVVKAVNLGKVTVAQQITNIMFSLVPINLFSSFQTGDLLAVITFSLSFGAAAIRASSESHSNLVALLNQMNHVFYAIINKIILLSPLAVVSLVAGSLSSQTSLSDSLSKVGVLVLTNFISVSTLHLGLYPALMFFFARRNPFTYWKMMWPCAMFAFGCASSMATLPVTLRCVQRTKEVSQSLLGFAVTIGCTVHMDGSAMFFPNALIFLATTSPEHIEIGYIEMFLIVLISVLGAIGTAPIPNASLVMVYSIWSTVFPNNDLPLSFSYIVAIMWYLDRVETVCNVVGDTFVCRMVAEQVDETYENMVEEQRF